MLRTFIVTTALLFSTAFTYVNASAPVALEGGKIGPKGKLEITLTNLSKETTYGITCNIENPNYLKANPAIIKVFPFSARVNDKESMYSQFKLDKLENTFYIVIFTGDKTSLFYPTIKIANYDDTDSIYVKDCMADYAI